MTCRKRLEGNACSGLRRRPFEGDLDRGSTCRVSAYASDASFARHFRLGPSLSTRSVAIHLSLSQILCLRLTLFPLLCPTLLASLSARTVWICVVAFVGVAMAGQVNDHSIFPPSARLLTRSL